MPAPDGVDRILSSEGAPLLAGARRVAVVDDETGALAAGVAGLPRPAGSELRVYCDSAAAEARVRDELSRSEPAARLVADLAEAVAGADLVLFRLPKTLAALEEIADTVARGAAPSVQLLAVVGSNTSTGA